MIKQSTCGNAQDRPTPEDARDVTYMIRTTRTRIKSWDGKRAHDPARNAPRHGDLALRLCGSSSYPFILIFASSGATATLFCETSPAKIHRTANHDDGSGNQVAARVCGDFGERASRRCTRPTVTTVEAGRGPGACARGLRPTFHEEVIWVLGRFHDLDSPTTRCTRRGRGAAELEDAYAQWRKAAASRDAQG